MLYAINVTKYSIQYNNNKKYAFLQAYFDRCFDIGTNVDDSMYDV